MTALDSPSQEQNFMTSGTEQTSSKKICPKELSKST